MIEGTFSPGWLALLTAGQLEFVRLLALHRGNVQKVAADLNIAYNTARSRLDEIAAALTPPPEPDPGRRLAILDQLAAGTLSFEEALRQLRAN